MYICPPVICTYIITFVHNSCQTMYIHYYICPPVMWRVTAVKLYTLLHFSTCHAESNSCETIYICPPVICTYIITFVHNSCQTMYIHYYICPPVMWRVTVVKLYTLLHLSTCNVESNSCQTMYICPPVICRVVNLPGNKSISQGSGKYREIGKQWAHNYGWQTLWLGV